MKTKLLAVACLLSVARLHAVGLVNGSFEDDVLDGSFWMRAPAGWSGSGTVGIVDAYYGGGYGFPASDGRNVLLTNGGLVWQDVGTIEAGINYSLMVDVINRPGSYNGYTIELRTSDGTILASEDSLLTPAPGDYLTSTLTYSASELDPAVGKTLEIRLGGAGLTYLDNVRLFAAVPEPAQFGVLSGAIVLCTALFRRRRR